MVEPTLALDGTCARHPQGSVPDVVLTQSPERNYAPDLRVRTPDHMETGQHLAGVLSDAPNPHAFPASSI